MDIDTSNRLILNYMTDDTISAIATPVGEAGIGIVRMSGPEAIKIADALFVSAKGKPVKSAKSHTVAYGFIRDPGTGEDIDEVLLTVMRAPKTYTREDIVEINCHGGLVPLGRVIELTLKYGARLAEPGEFTKRAFLNGRIDLTQAEAVADLIRAKTDASQRIALEQMRGALGRKIEPLREKLLDILVHVEAHIDFPEEEIEPETMEGISNVIKSVIDALSGLSKTYDEGRFFRDGLKAAIVGRPNVGKSSLLNALLQKDRAIVTELPGTTRDVIEGFLNIKGLPLQIMDTAGIREAHNMAEAEGVKRSLQALDDADLGIAVFDGSTPLKDEDMTVIERLKDKTSIAVINKSDLPDAGIRLPALKNIIKVSAKTEKGLEEMKEGIFDMFVKRSALSEPSGEMITNLRHKIAIDKAGAGLSAALNAIKTGQPLEIIGIELKDAAAMLSGLTGVVTAEDILQRIFSRFCIGK